MLRATAAAKLPRMAANGADILGLPINALKNGEAGTVGACMIASVALGALDLRTRRAITSASAGCMSSTRPRGVVRRTV